MPAHASLRRLLERIGPVTATSANRSGAAPCVDPDEVARVFDGDIDVLVDGGRTPGGLRVDARRCDRRSAAATARGCVSVAAGEPLNPC